MNLRVEILDNSISNQVAVQMELKEIINPLKIIDKVVKVEVTVMGLHQIVFQEVMHKVMIFPQILLGIEVIDHLIEEEDRVIINKPPRVKILLCK